MLDVTISNANKTYTLTGVAYMVDLREPENFVRIKLVGRSVDEIDRMYQEMEKFKGTSTTVVCEKFNVTFDCVDVMRYFPAYSIFFKGENIVWN